MSESQHGRSDFEFVEQFGRQLAEVFDREEERAYQRRVRRRRLFPVLVTAGLATCGLLLALVLPGASTDSSAKAAEQLDRAAQAAGAMPDRLPGDEQFFHVITRVAILETSANGSAGSRSLLITSRRNIWQSISKTGRLEDQALSATDLDGTPVDIANSPTSPAQVAPVTIPPIGHYSIGRIALTSSELASFPTAGKAIIERLGRADPQTKTDPGRLFDQIADALREAPTPSDLRAGLFRSLALVPGIRSFGAQTDSEHRQGQAVGIEQDGTRHELLFDPSTSQVLSETELVTNEAASGLNVPDGTVVRNATYLVREITDGLPN